MLISGHEIIRRLSPLASAISLSIRGEYPYWVVSSKDNDVLKTDSAMEVFETIKNKYKALGKKIPNIF